MVCYYDIVITALPLTVPPTMHKTLLSSLFRERLKTLLAAETRGTATFLREAGLDRSALSQFLDPDNNRLPRAETLRRLAVARDVSVDWLLGLENAPEGRQAVAPSVQIERATDDDGTTPLARWRREAAGYKLRYVPSTLPDMLSLDAPAETDTVGTDRVDSATRGGGAEAILEGIALQDMDVEIAMPKQTLEALAGQTGLWQGACPRQCHEQLRHMATTCADTYPALRLHLYDGLDTFSAPVTVFGHQRAALYIGDAYLVVTANEQVRAFIRHFDRLVRAAVVSPDAVPAWIHALSDATRGNVSRGPVANTGSDPA